MIERLKNLSPEERPALMNERYEKNRRFFRRHMPSIDQFLEKSKCNYRIDITEKFLNIVHGPTGQLGHPEAGLDIFAMMMGDWVHEAWVDLFNFNITAPGSSKIHSTPLRSMSDFIARNFPTYIQNHASKQINLKVIEDGRRFSPPVIFLGIFHGLHIDYFFHRTDISRALFIEPDAGRFEVSCYFLDYEVLMEKLGGALHIILGDNETSWIMQLFFRGSIITPLIWTRVLPGYEIPQAPVIIEHLKLFQTIRSDIVFPLDNEIRGLINGVFQIKKNRLLLSEDIATSSQCRIAVVATGPSLTNDLRWLKKNQQKLIIFAVHSSVKILRNNGIIPDFQFSLDIDSDDPQLLASLELCRDKPLVQYYKATDAYFDLVDTVLMVAEGRNANPVIFKKYLIGTHPSSTCLAFSLAEYCAPKEIYLIGCDFGYRSVEKDHAAGSHHDELQARLNRKTHYGNTIQALVSPNFPGAGLIQTTAFLSNAKGSLEGLIAINKNKCKVYNFSDGVKVQQTIPKRSSHVVLKKYPNKQKDIARIMAAFKKAERNENWFPCSETGSEALQEMKKTVIDKLTLKKFTWLDAVKAIDRSLDEQRAIFEKKNDFRIDCYMRVLADLLSGIYCCLLFHDSEREAAKVYELSIEELSRILENDFYWPKELDEIA